MCLYGPVNRDLGNDEQGSRLIGMTFSHINAILLLSPLNRAGFVFSALNFQNGGSLNKTKLVLSKQNKIAISTKTKVKPKRISFDGILRTYG